MGCYLLFFSHRTASQHIKKIAQDNFFLLLDLFSLLVLKQIESMENAATVEATNDENFAMFIECNRSWEKIAVVEETVRDSHTGNLFCIKSPVNLS